MSAAARAILAASLVAIVAFAGSWYVGYRRGVAEGQNAGSDTTLASLNFNLLDGRTLDRQLIRLTYDQLQRRYYKPIDAPVLVQGEHQRLLRYLQSTLAKRHVRIELPAPSKSAAAVSALDDQLAYAQTHYAALLGKSGRSDLTAQALDGMLGSLHDPYTVYLTPREIQQLNESLDGGDFGGIGVYIQELQDGEIVITPIEGMPAQHAGMHDVEVVQSIDGKPIKGLPIDTVEQMIRGPQGTTVTLTVHPYKGHTVRQFKIVREVIHVPTVYAKYEKPYEYIRLTDFGETSAAEMRKALLRGTAHHAKGFILDLRDNGGGLLDAAVAISSYFIPKGVIVTEIDRAGDKKSEYAQGDVIPGDTPLAILVNGYTASASEITSGALQDYHLATLIGTKTFGKGVVQGIFSMPNGGALKITTERYVTPSGRDIQHKGIEPNILVRLPCVKTGESPCSQTDPSLFDGPHDTQLAAAKAFLSHLKR